MEQKIICNSCKKDLKNDSGSVIFDCPQCGKTKIIRCKHCRSIASKYTCHECGFKGPN